MKVDTKFIGQMLEGGWEAVGYRVMPNLENPDERLNHFLLVKNDGQLRSYRFSDPVDDPDPVQPWDMAVFEITRGGNK